MYQKSATIQNATGLHARPASDFVSCAKQFSSAIKIRKEGVDGEANAKSVVKLLSMELTQGSVVTLSAEGDDETAAVEALVELIQSFSE